MRRKLNYVVSKTPLRVSFLGGGTDIPYFYKKYGGATFNVAINKFVYVTVKKHSKYFIENYRLNYYDTEICQKILQIRNSIIRETLKYLNIKTPLYISVISDIPTGSGLGGSSSFIIGLINALCKLENIKINKSELLRYATKIEIDILKKPIGKQDHLPAIYGGMLYTKYLKNDEISINKIRNIKLKVPINIIWTNTSRDSYLVLNDQKKRLKKNLEYLKIMKKLCEEFYYELTQNKKIDHKILSNYINQSWRLKKKLSPFIKVNKADKIISLAQKKKVGSKLLGAGGGGFILYLGKKNKKIFKNYIYEDVKIYDNGTEIITFQKD